MTGWVRHSGHAIALPMENVDTDQLIPARFMSASRAEGYGSYLLHDLRVAPDGTALPDMPLNRHPNASILVTGRNFGSGSSREAAVYALVDFGMRAVVAPSFGDIFAANAVNNGLLPAMIDGADCERLLARLDGRAIEATIDLERQTVTLEDQSIGFTLDPVWRLKLINGWDDIDLTASHAPAIHAFAEARSTAYPWSVPRGVMEIR